MAADNDPVAFVESLVLPEPGPEEARVTEGERPARDDKDKYTAAGSLVSFVAGVPFEHKQDTLDSTLLAQLAASARFDREKQTEDWYKFYRTVLENVGWVIQEFEFTDYRDLGNEFTAEKVVLKILEAIATGNDLAIVAATIEALNSLDKDAPAFKVFETESYAQRRGNFQIAVASESDGVVVLKIGAFYFVASEDIVRILWFRFKTAQTKFYKASQVLNLDDRVYSKVRQAVIEKLGNRAITFVKTL